MKVSSALRLLLAQPHHFHFDSVLRVLMRRARTRDPADAALFRTDPARAYPAAEATTVEIPEGGAKPRLTVSLIGLIGTGGPLPRLYETLAAEMLRRGSSALHDFIDFLSHRMLAAFGGAGIKYRLHRAAEVPAHAGAKAPDPISRTILHLGGWGTSDLVERSECGPEPLLYYAGFFAMRPRSADRLAALLSDWLDRPVKVSQFAGTWLTLPLDQQTVLPRANAAGSWNQLGVDATIGDRAWDTQAKIEIWIGPLDQCDFEKLMPGGPVYRQLVALTKAFLGPEVGFDIHPILAGCSRFPLRIDADASPRLGWNTWTSLPSGDVSVDLRDAAFDVGVDIGFDTCRI
jgi:type VI secretion system protein ImpH